MGRWRCLTEWERVEQTPMESKQQGWKEVRSHETFVTKETEASLVAHPRAEGGQGWDCNGAPTLQSTERPGKPGPADFGTWSRTNDSPVTKKGLSSHVPFWVEEKEDGKKNYW